MNAPAAAPSTTKGTFVDPTKCILVLPDAFPAEMCDELIATAEAHEPKLWRPAVVGDDKVIPTVRSCSNFPLSLAATKFPALGPIDLKVMDAVVAGVQEFDKHNGILPLRDQGYEILRYGQGDHYTTHIDIGGVELRKRLLSVIAFLNDDFVGGEVWFDRYDITVRPAKGTMVVFPSGYPFSHAVKPVIAGLRYSLITWLK